MRYGIFSLLKNSLSGHQNWPAAWREPEPKLSYDVIIVGGGHGLATAYYLAKEHNITKVAVRLENLRAHQRHLCTCRGCQAGSRP